MITLNKFTNRQLSLWLFLLSLVVYFLSTLPLLATAKAVLIGEAWYAEPAYNFSIGKGFLNEAIGSGGNANFLNALCIGICYKLFGISIFVTRLTPVLSGALFIFVLHQVFKRFNSALWIQIVCYAVVMSIAFFNTVFTNARPEALALFCLSLSTYFYLMFIKEKTNSAILLLALSLALGVCTHPFLSLFFVLYGLHILYIVTKYKRKDLSYSILLYGIAGVLSVLLILLVDYFFNSDGTNSFFKR